MTDTFPQRLAHAAGTARRSARQGPFGRRRACEAGAAPTDPRGVAPPPASAAVTPPKRSRPLPLVWAVPATALATFLIVTPAAAQTMADRARAAAAAAHAKTGDSAALQRNYVTPGLAGQPITTVDNSKAFTPNLACRKTATLMEVLVQPSSSGDLGLVQIARDTDFDGTIDSRINLPVPVSGICANGVIACQAGTWNQCNYLRWDVDAARTLKLAQVDMPALAGCYCINNSCGTNLAWSNMASVLGDLGGGMIGALTTADPRIGVTQAVIDGPVIRYVGAQSTACASDPSLAQTGYRTNPSALTGDAFTASTANSVFQALAASPAGAGKAEQSRACTIERQIAVKSWDYDDIVSAVGPFQSVTRCGAGCRIYRIGGTGNCNDPPATFTGRFTANKPDRIVSARIVDLQTADWLQARVNGTPVAYASKRPWLTNALPRGDCGVGDTYSAYPNYDFAGALKAGTVAVDARIRAKGGHKTGYLNVRIEVDTRCETSERLVDLCSGNSVDPQCRLQSEDVDGVATFFNGVATGLKPLPQTRLFGSAACTLQYTRDFFRRDRRYKCVIDTGAPAAPDLSRGAYIIDHSTETMLADRARQTDGSFAASTRPFALPDRGSVPACEPICKTRAPRVNTAAAPAGVVGNLQNNPTGYDSFYHVCGTGNVCPTGPGEAIVSACGCLDDFPEAVVMMQTVRLGGADLVCTRTVR